MKFIDETPELLSADFALIIDFTKGEGSPTRIFSVAKDLIEAFQAIDKALVKSIDSNITPIMMLENVESGSIKIHLRSMLESVDDEALKTLNWKKIVGDFLVLGKYKILNWMETLDDKEPKSLPDLREGLQKIASETGVRRLPDYSSPDPNGLIDGMKKIQKAKDRLLPKDQAFLESGGKKHKINTVARFETNYLVDLATKRTDIIEPSQIILTVKKPDYLGKSKWDFLIKKNPISARIEDSVFISNFQGRKQDVRPGDALRCTVSMEIKYDFNDELISKTYVILEVLEVLDGN